MKCLKFKGSMKEFQMFLKSLQFLFPPNLKVKDTEEYIKLTQSKESTIIYDHSYIWA